MIWTLTAVALFGVAAPPAPIEAQLAVGAPSQRELRDPSEARAATATAAPVGEDEVAGGGAQTLTVSPASQPAPGPTVPTTVPPPSPLPTTAEVLPPPAEPAPSNDQDFYRDIEVRVTTDASTYVEDGPVRVTVSVCNIGTAPVRFQVYEGQEVGVAILDDAGEAVAGDMGDAGEFVWRTWQPAECTSYGEFLWWHERYRMGDEPGHGYPRAPAGGYRAQGEFFGQPERDPRTPPPDNGPRGVSDRFELEGVTVEVSTDKVRYGPDEPVVVTAHVCNPSDRVHTQTFWWSPEATIRIGRDGHILAGNHVDGPTDAYTRTFLPGECVDYHYTWTEQREPATYEAGVSWWGHSRPDVAEENRHRWLSAEPVTFSVA